MSVMTWVYLFGVILVVLMVMATWDPSDRY